MPNRQPDLFSYVVDTDSGFAPNPYGDICTLACCKSSIRQNANIGDWIIGTTKSPNTGRLVYAMQVDRSLTFDLYWDYPEYEHKKPCKNNMCGDNIYKKGTNGVLVQMKNISHGEEHFQSDTKVNRVLISKTFYYFGQEAPEIPSQHKNIIKKGRGYKRTRPTAKNYDVVTEFLEWLQNNFKQGVHGNPAHLKKKCKLPDIKLCKH